MPWASVVSVSDRERETKLAPHGGHVARNLPSCTPQNLGLLDVEAGSGSSHKVRISLDCHVETKENATSFSEATVRRWCEWPSQGLTELTRDSETSPAQIDGYCGKARSNE
jgi:hypothetical protein